MCLFMCVTVAIYSYVFRLVRVAENEMAIMDTFNEVPADDDSKVPKLFVHKLGFHT